MEILIEYINSIETNVTKITELFYQNNNHEALACMPELLDYILKMAEVLETLANVSEEDKLELAKILREALKAMEEQDYVLLADILQYDMIDNINNIKNMFGIN